MSHSETYEAIVLKTYDVGEADRFCILLTRERGRLAARARGVRKLKSRMGGSLLSFQHVTVNMKETSAGFLIISSQQKEGLRATTKEVSSFVQAQQGIEMLISVLHDEEPLPEVFDLTLEFLQACRDASASPVLPFAIRLLYLLGHLSQESFGKLSEQQGKYVQICMTNKWITAESLTEKEARKISAICTALLSEQAGKPLRAAGVGGMILHS